MSALRHSTEAPSGSRSIGSARCASGVTTPELSHCGTEARRRDSTYPCSAIAPPRSGRCRDSALTWRGRQSPSHGSSALAACAAALVGRSHSSTAAFGIPRAAPVAPPSGAGRRAAPAGGCRRGDVLGGRRRTSSYASSAARVVVIRKGISTTVASVISEERARSRSLFGIREDVEVVAPLARSAPRRTQRRRCKR